MLRALRCVRVCRWRHKLVGLIFDEWKAAVQRAKHLLQRAGGAWRNTSMAMAWRQWLDVWRAIQVAEQAKAAAEAAREKDRALLGGLRSVGLTWFEEMLRQAGTGARLTQAAGATDPTVAEGEGEDGEGEEGKGGGRPTVLRLLDGRYTRLAKATRDAAQLDRDLQTLEQHVEDSHEQSAARHDAVRLTEPRAQRPPPSLHSARLPCACSVHCPSRHTVPAAPRAAHR